LRFASTDKGAVAVENYMFDQDVARKAFYTMITLHEYPLSIVDHLGFRQFVSALQPLFKIGTRNTIRKGILNCYDVEKRKARMFLLVAEFLLLVVAEFLLSSREDDTRSWGNFLVYFSHNAMPT